ncbi:hypothetical protein niasHT_024881 [Heterodera trifolii]|uniref:Uncharacterized protein n=1 Tax=Heterodera trifolii TaxID=157864 RepID=A0ABD2KFG9_9BILA
MSTFFPPPHPNFIRHPTPLFIHPPTDRPYQNAPFQTGHSSSTKISTPVDIDRMYQHDQKNFLAEPNNSQQPDHSRRRSDLLNEDGKKDTDQRSDKRTTYRNQRPALRDDQDQIDSERKNDKHTIYRQQERTIRKMHGRAKTENFLINP